MKYDTDPTSETPLARFQKTMETIKAGELLKKAEWETRGKTGDAYDPHFDAISPGFLTDTDRQLWDKIETKTLTRDQIQTYDTQLEEELGEAKPAERETRENFRAMAVNKASFIIERELKEREKRRKELQ